MRHIGSYQKDQSMATLAALLLARIRSNRGKTAAGSYLMGDERGRVYVIAEESSLVQVALSRHGAWLIGTYASGDKPYYPSETQLVEDMRDHFSSMG